MAEGLVSASSRASDFKPNPVFWERLTAEDQAEFIRLTAELHHCQKSSGKDRRVVSFQKELNLVLAFLERDELRREERSILTGIAFAGRFVCVNTRLLKSFLGRCKSSINGGFQQMGYVAIRTKAKARNCIVAVMRSLTNDAALLRQWTVRGLASNVASPFVSSFPTRLLPEINNSDLNLEKPGLTLQSPARVTLPVKTERISDPAPRVRPQEQSRSNLECFTAFDDTEWNIPCEEVMNCYSDVNWGMGDFGLGPEMGDVDREWVRSTMTWLEL
jgi:hypothetical protein